MSIFTPSSWNRCQLTARDRRNQQRLLIWLLAWSVAWVLANIAIKEGWAPAGIPAVAVAVLPTLLGVVMMLVYWKFIREADELQRKIHLDALALGFGIGVVGAFTIHLLQRADLLTSVDMADVSALMMVTYAIGTLFGVKRYA